MLLRVSNVETLYYDVLLVLHGVSLEVPEGKIVCVIGSNGAGKSTLLKTIMGLIPDQPDKGTIEFMGQRIQWREPETISRLGISYVPEGRGLFPELTVRENLVLGAYRRKDRDGVRKDMERVCALFSFLRDRSEQQAGLLSGGEQQMLSIARALLNRPALLMLDEPSLGLAPIVVKEIFKAIHEINAQGTAILLVEQNARMALSVSHYGYVMESGRCVLEGSVEDLTRNENVQEMYLGVSAEKTVKGYRRYKKRRRW